jgi:hypothetical protein
VCRKVEPVGDRQLDELTHHLGLWMELGPSESVTEPRPIMATELREEHPAVAARVKVHDRLSGRTDHLDEVVAPRRDQERGWEAVGTAGRVAKPRGGERGRCPPTRQEIRGPAQVGEERAPRMPERAGSVGLEKGEDGLVYRHAWSRGPREDEKIEPVHNGDPAVR